MRSKSFMTNIWISILGSFALLVVAVFILLNVCYREELMKNARLQYRYEDEIRRQAIEDCTYTVNSCLNTVIMQLNAAFEEGDLHDGYPSIRTATQKKIYHCLLSSFKMFRSPLEMMIVWNNGVYFYQGSMYRMDVGAMAAVEELDALPVTRQGLWISRLENASPLEGDGVFCVKPFTDVRTNQAVGYIVLKLDERSLGLEDDSGNRSFCLFTSDGLMLRSNSAALAQPVLEAEGYADRLESSLRLWTALEKRNERDELVSFTELTNGWRLVSVTSTRYVLEALNRTILLLLGASAVIFMILYGLVGAVVNHAVHPVRRLSSHMLAFADGMPEEFRARHRRDEIGVLIECYNLMVNRLQNQLDEILEGRQNQKQLEFALLQSQIKPHFLYNTLDTIYCLNAMGRYGEASEMTKLLSEYYRKALNNGMEWISLSEEVEISRIYLEIQCVRYKNVLSFEIVGMPAGRNPRIPKLTLQPLVENAIYHGVKPAGRPGRVRICISEDESALSIRVSDDGVGFDRALFDRIVSEPPEAGRGYGLCNVAQRLKFYYGNRCDFLLEQDEPGTTVLLVIRDESGKEH